MNAKSEILIVFGLILGIFLISNISASIYFSQLGSIYNIGDMIEMNVNVSPQDSGPLKVVLFCDNVSLDVYRGSPTELIQLPLTTLWMNGITGECHFTGYYGGESIESTVFKISKKLNINLYTTSFYVKPGEVIRISGNAKRLNGEPISGEVELRVPIPETNYSKERIYGVINNGEFNIDYALKKETPAGDYRIDIFAYEKSVNEKTSEGVAYASMQVSQVIKNIDIALDIQNLEPGKALSYKLLLNDQSDNSIEGNVAVEIRDPNNARIFQKIVKSGETLIFDAPSNATAGYYEIEASNDNLVKTKKFHVTENAQVSFEVINGTLIIRNIGNIPYNRTIEVNINGKNFFIKPDQLGNFIPGEKREFKLTGDREMNSLTIDDKVSNLALDNIVLPIAKQPNLATGAAIGISDIVATPIAWIFILVILAIVILFLFRDIFKKKSITYPVPLKYQKENYYLSESPRILRLDRNGKEIKEDTLERIKPENIVKRELEEKGMGEKELDPIRKPLIEKKTEVKYYNPSYAPYNPNLRKESKQEIFQRDIPVKKEIKETPFTPRLEVVGKRKIVSPNEAEQVLVTDGQKSRAAVIALKIKNSINKSSKENLEKAIEHVYEQKGAVNEHGDYIFVLFSPLITKSFRNEIEATKAAERIADALKEHNKKFAEKIEFGIAVNSGDVINKIEDKKLKFTSLGTLTISAKKLADISNGQVLLTKEAYEKAMSEVKADKKQINGIEVYEVKKVADYEKNKKFINEFLKREGEIKSKNMIPGHSVTPKSNPYWIKDENNSNADIT